MVFACEPPFSGCLGEWWCGKYPSLFPVALSLLGVMKHREAQGGVQTFRPPCPPWCTSCTSNFLCGVCKNSYVQCKNDFALIKTRYLRKPLRGGVSSSEVSFKPSRTPVETAGILQHLPAISSTKLQQKWRHSLGKISLVPTSQFKTILRVKSSEEPALILL